MTVERLGPVQLRSRVVETSFSTLAASLGVAPESPDWERFSSKRPFLDHAAPTNLKLQRRQAFFEDVAYGLEQVQAEPRVQREVVALAIELSRRRASVDVEFNGLTMEIREQDRLVWSWPNSEGR